MRLSLAVFEAAMRVKSTHLIKSCLKTGKKERNYGNKRNFKINLYLVDGLGMEFTACWGELTPERVMTSFTVSDVYSLRVRLLRSKNRSRIECLIPTNNIMVLDWYFNFTNKSNLVDSNTIFDHLEVIDFLGPPCTSQKHVYDVRSK